MEQSAPDGGAGPRLTGELRSGASGADGGAQLPAVIHRYLARCSWAGSTGAGYDGYGRDHRVEVPPAADLRVSADPAFRGDPGALNPEQLLLAAAASCQLLSFLAVAARARLDVVSYRDEAEAVMPEDDRPVRITEIRLRPDVTLRGPADPGQVRHLLEVAHRECFIANTLTAAVVIDPTIIVLDD